MLFTRQQRIQQHGHNERHSDAVGCEDGLEQRREVDENVTDLRETDADGEAQRCNGDVALRVAGLGNHLEARQDDVTEHHDGATAKHGLRQGIEHFRHGRNEACDHQNQTTGKNHLTVDDLGHGDQADILCERRQRKAAEQTGDGGDETVACDGARSLLIGRLTVETNLGERRGIAEHLYGRHDVQQGEGDNRTRIEFKLERHEMRHGHDLQIRESREINLAHENRDNIADNQAEQHGKLLGGTLHQQLES